MKKQRKTLVLILAGLILIFFILIFFIKAQQFEEEQLNETNESQKILFEEVPQDINKTLGLEANTIETVFNETTNVNTEIQTKQYQATVGKPVEWQKKVKLNMEGENNVKGVKDLEIKLPVLAEDISVKRTGTNGQELEINIENEEEVLLEIKEEILDKEEIIIEYNTPAPSIEELEINKNNKEIIITGPEEIHYENILAFSQLPSQVANLNKIKFYHIVDESRQQVDFEAYDLDEDGLYDYIEWIVPHLSTQFYEVILITNAEHLDSNRNFISNIYEEVKELDDVCSETIIEGHYVRVVFEQNLTSENDIMVYPQIISGNPRIEIYEKDENDLIAELVDLNDNEYNKVFLENLQGSQDTFDLLILNGDIQFDHIIDPAPVISWVEAISAVTLTGGGTKDIYIKFNVSGESINASSAKIEITHNEESRTSSLCTNNTHTNEFNCTITMQFYDSAGSWNINASIKDNFGDMGINTSVNFTVNSLDYILQDITIVNWTSILAGQNNEEAKVPMILTNEGNQNYSNISIMVYDATGGTYSEVIYAANFSIDDATGQSNGTYMVNNTFVQATQLTGLNNHGALITEELYFYVDVTAGIKPDTYTSDMTWRIKALT